MRRVCQRQRRLLWVSLRESYVSPAVYPCFLKLLHVDIQSTGRTLSRPWSRQSNDATSETECAQLHNELLKCRHSTLQSHGLFALAKHLYSSTTSETYVGKERRCRRPLCAKTTSLTLRRWTLLGRRHGADVARRRRRNMSSDENLNTLLRHHLPTAFIQHVSAAVSQFSYRIK